MLATLDRQQVEHWPLERLRPSEHNPRGPVSDTEVAELAESIREQGILQPLVVLPDGTVLIGHRRLAAARVAGLAEAPVIVRNAPALADQLSIQLVENIQRKDLTPLQEARAFRDLLDSGVGLPDLGRRLGLVKHYIQGRLYTLELAPEVQTLVDRRELPITAVSLLRKVDWATQRRLAARVAARHITTVQLKRLIDGEATNKSNGHTEPTSREPNHRMTTSRSEAVALLKQNAERALTCADLLRAFNLACAASPCAECGMAELEAACRECPGPALVRFLVSNA